MDDDTQTFEHETPPPDFDLSREASRAGDASGGGISERVTGEEVGLQPGIHDEGVADDDDDDALDPDDDDTPLDPAI